MASHTIRSRPEFASSTSPLVTHQSSERTTHSARYWLGHHRDVVGRAVAWRAIGLRGAGGFTAQAISCVPRPATRLAACGHGGVCPYRRNRWVVYGVQRCGLPRWSHGPRGAAGSACTVSRRPVGALRQLPCGAGRWNNRHGADLAVAGPKCSRGSGHNQRLKADRGRHPGFPSFNVLAGGPGSLAER